MTAAKIHIPGPGVRLGYCGRQATNVLPRKWMQPPEETARQAQATLGLCGTCARTWNAYARRAGDPNLLVGTEWEDYQALLDRRAA